MNTKTLSIYDPAMCCSTGVCGPEVDPKLVRFSADIEWLRDNGVKVERFNLAQEPGAFASLAACVLKNVERFSHMLPFEYAGASVDVELERQDSPPPIVRASYRLVVDTEEPAARCSLLHKNIRKFGTISNTLALACALSGSMQARRAGSDVEEIDSTSPDEA